MDNKTIAAILASAVIVTAGVSLRPAPAAPTINVAPPAITVNVPPANTPDVNVTNEAPTSQATNFGALSSPDLPYPYFSVNGVRQFSLGTNFIQSSTTLCALQAVGTSTVNFAKTSARFDTGSTSAMTVILAKGTGLNATTTQLGNDWTLGANTKGTVHASSTAAQEIAASEIIAPGDWVKWSARGGSGTFSSQGQCNIVLDQI